MAQKNATPTKEQARVIRKNGLDPARWVVIKDFPHSLIIKRMVSEEFRLINK